MKKNNLLVALLFSVIALFAGCSMDTMDNEDSINEENSETISEEAEVLEDVLPVCIVTNYRYSLLADVSTYYDFFKYDSLNRIVEIKGVRRYITILTLISYESDKIKVERTSVEYPDEKDVTIFNYDGSKVIAEGEKPIYINEKLQVTSYTKYDGLSSFQPYDDFSFIYDESGNISSYTHHPWRYLKSTKTLKYDDKNGVFRNVNTPSWFLVTQMGDEVAFHSIYNNCVLSVEEAPLQSQVDGTVKEPFSGYEYEYTYNSAGYPEKINIIPVKLVNDDTSLSYEIYYTESDAPVPAIPPVEPVNPEPVYDLSATITTKEGYTGEVFIGKAIQSFNPETHEIVFYDNNILTNLNELAPIQLNIFKEKEFLMSATVIASDAPQTVNDLVFLIDVKKRGNFYYPQEFKYYFLDGYPALDKISGDKEEAGQMRETNAQKRKTNWDIFLKYLTEAGKIVE